MHSKQVQVLDSFARVLAFVKSHPAKGPLRYGDALETLDEAVRRAHEYAGQQLSGKQLGGAELRRQRQLIGRLRDHHMRPIVTIARAQIEPDSDVRLQAAMRMPACSIGVTNVLAACDAMIGAAELFAPVLLAHGLPTDFLERFRQARNEVVSILGIRAAYNGLHVGARQGLKVELRRGRRAVDRLDAVVRVSFEYDEPVLAAWRAAKRVHHRPGGHGASLPTGEEATAGEQVPSPVVGRSLQLAA